MKRIFSYTISEDWTGRKISEFLKAQGYSAHLLTHLRNNGDFIRQNEAFVHMNALLAGGDSLEVVLEEGPSEKVIPTPLPLDIVYEDADILVLNKPAGMPSHPSRGVPETTLGNAVAAYYAAKGEELVYRCINRLDKNTSGLTVIAKHALSGAILYEEQLAGRIHRVYTAVVAGHFDEPAGVIDLPIARLAEDSVLRCVDYENGKRAVTNYSVVQSLPSGFSVVECRLETGRTHQIRVHMKAFGHPLLGDHLYFPEDDHLARQALHAGMLDFFHPITKEPLHFEAVLPNDLQELLQRLSVL